VRHAPAEATVDAGSNRCAAGLFFSDNEISFLNLYK
jgi:hypothetical protein